MGARTILGRKFDAEIPNLTLLADGIQEWSLRGATKHPFHLHIYHVQVIGDCGDYEDGEYYDVIAGNCDIRFDLNQETSSVYEGRTIFHCHILEHEDQGAMAWADIIGGLAPPLFPINNDIGFPYQDYYPLGGSGPAPPSGLTATAISSSEIDLFWTDNANDEDGFDLERSLDGMSFNLIATVSTDVTSFSDSGLAADTTYSYRVSAFNTNGNSVSSNTATATTDPVGQGTSLEVSSISVSTNNLGRGFRSGVAVVVVQDDLGNLISGAVVSGEFTGDINNEVVNASTPTDGSGSTTIESIQSVKPLNSLDFCVTAITHDSLQDFVAEPGEVCGSL
jgi:hypothetical protein